MNIFQKWSLTIIMMLGSFTIINAYTHTITNDSRYAAWCYLYYAACSESQDRLQPGETKPFSAGACILKYVRCDPLLPKPDPSWGNRKLINPYTGQIDIPPNVDLANIQHPHILYSTDFGQYGISSTGYEGPYTGSANFIFSGPDNHNNFKTFRAVQ